MNDGLNKMKTMNCSLQQLERERSDAREKLCEATVQIEQLQKQVIILIFSMSVQFNGHLYQICLKHCFLHLRSRA